MRRGPRRYQNAHQHVQPLTPDRLEVLLHGAPVPDIHANQRLEQRRKELAVPDMKTALEKALSKTINQWADDDAQQPKEKPMSVNTNASTNASTSAPAASTTKAPYLFQETVGVTRAVFNHVADNPGISRIDARNALIAKGFKASSVDGILTQYVRAGIFIYNKDGNLISTTQRYTSLPSPATLKRRQQQAQAAQTPEVRQPRAHAAKERPAAPITKPHYAAPQVDAGGDVQAILDSLSVVKARALYDALGKIFGDNK